MPYNKGFRCFNLRWVVSSLDTEGSTLENDDPESGKILNSNGTFGYTDDKWGVRRCLEDFCNPLYTTSGNGNGWQLDTDLCPNNHAVNLIPNERVWALFFKHSTGARLMLGLNYFGMISTTYNPSPEPPTYTSNTGWWDIGFLSKFTITNYPTTDPSYNSSSATTYESGTVCNLNASLTDKRLGNIG